MDTQNKIYLLNLQQQVRKNQLMIESLAQGLRIIGAGETLPEQAADMDAYLLSGEDGYSLYLRISGEWVDMGRFPAQGEPGPAGPKGSVGTIGSIVCNATPIDFGLNPSVSATVSGDNVTFDFELPRGETGIQGPQGPQGPRGLTGPRGLQGQQGDPGKAFRIIRNDSVVTPSDLPAASTAGEGVGYLVGTAEQGYTLYVTAYVDPADTDPSDLVWVDAGPFIPSEVIVDHQLALESLNAIANDPVTRALGSKPLAYFRDKENITEDLSDFVKDGLPISEQPTGTSAYTTKYVCFGGALHFSRNTRNYISFVPENDDDLNPQVKVEWIHASASTPTYFGGFWLANKEVLDGEIENLNDEIARSTREDEIHQREIVLLKNLVYDTIAASYSYNIDYAFYSEVPTSVEVSGQYHSILDDAGAQVEKISGSSVVWNQPLQGYRLPLTKTLNGVTLTNNLFGTTLELSGTATDDCAFTGSYFGVAPVGHKVLFGCEGFALSTGSVYFNLGNIANNVVAPLIAQISGNTKVDVIVKSGTSLSGVSLRPFFVDLTVCFPTDTPSSVSDPRVLSILSNTGKAFANQALKSSVVKSVISHGFNLWDEIVEQGNLSDGVPTSSSNRCRSKNFIPCIPNLPIFFYKQDRTTYKLGYVSWYDANKQYIKNEFIYGNETKTAPSNARFLKMTMMAADTTSEVVPANFTNICINRSNVALNGTYKPHVADQLVDLEALGLTEAQRTLRSAGTVRDDLSLVEQQDGTYNLVKNTLAGNYTFTGDETWIAYGTGWRTVVLTGKEYASIGGGEIPSNVISDTGLTLTSRNSIDASGGDALSLTGDTILVGSKNGLTGKTIVYELATPTSETLLTGLEFGVIELIVERGGSLNVDADNAKYGAVPGLVMDLPILMYE